MTEDKNNGSSFIDPTTTAGKAGAKKLREQQELIQGKMDRLSRTDIAAAQFVQNQMLVQRMEFILEHIMPLNVVGEGEDSYPQNMERIEFEREWNDYLITMMDDVQKQAEQMAGGLVVPGKKLHVPGQG